MAADMPPLLLAQNDASTTKTITATVTDLSRSLHVRQLMGSLLTDDSQAPLLLGVTGLVLLVGLLLLTARILSRVKPVCNLKADDWTVLASAIIAMANFILISHACTHGFGRRADFVSEESRKTALLMIFICHAMWNIGIVLVKISVGMLLLRLQSSRALKVFLHITMAILVINGAVQTILHFMACRPFRIYWDPFSLLNSNGQLTCLPLDIIKANIIISSTIHVAVDLIFAFIPTLFIWKLHRPRSEKVFLAVLMGFGLFTALFVILRTVDLPQFTTSPDRFRASVQVTLWATLEHEFALIAATIPTLKAFMQSMLLHIGNMFYTEEAETEVRGKLVDFGLLGASEDLTSKPGRRGAVVERPKPVRKNKSKYDLDSTLVQSKLEEDDVGLVGIGSKI